MHGSSLEMSPDVSFSGLNSHKAYPVPVVGRLSLWFSALSLTTRSTEAAWPLQAMCKYIFFVHSWIIATVKASKTSWSTYITDMRINLFYRYVNSGGTILLVPYLVSGDRLATSALLVIMQCTHAKFVIFLVKIVCKDQEEKKNWADFCLLQCRGGNIFKPTGNIDGRADLRLGNACCF